MGNGLYSIMIVTSLLWSLGARAKTVEIKIENMKFDPQNVVVSTGDKITWINKDLVPHTVTAAGSFDSKTIAPNRSWHFKVKKKGHFDYKCFFHPVMLGSIDVQ
jgi:plastocyanin